ncbi:DUF11 domain-containing protein [Leucobacter sp. CSA2]|uniref:DUF11 domain-containing protein n=1 Tax=Leucobacter edaphi TaxID=2796472 RepID=A0A934QDB7_9MICO|nr:DUF11 domain-containing protein [Leucobacter edaphi]MBK0422128.1 DUF11 domain-containing protein [Leucobacter edaphi]
MTLPATAADAAPGELVGGTVTVDANHDGAIATGEPIGENDLPAAGVLVTLRGTNPGHPGWTVTTDAAGHWAFPADADRSASPGPFTVTIDAHGVAGDAYLVPATATPGVNDFVREGADAQRSVSAPIPADAEGLTLNALVAPTWRLDLIAAGDPSGYQNLAIRTGKAAFDGDDDAPGHDAGPANDRIRSGDLITFDWSVTASEEVDLGGSFTGWFEQTIVLGEGAVANFGEVPNECGANSTITAQPSGKRLPARVDPPAGTTSVVLACELGAMSEAQPNHLLPTQIFVSGSSANGAKLSTDVRSYGVAADGTATARPAKPQHYGDFVITAAPAYDLEKQRPSVRPLGQKDINGQKKYGWEVVYSVQIAAERNVGVEGLRDPVTFEDSLWALSSDGKSTPLPEFPWEITSCVPDTGNASAGPGATTVYGKIGGALTSGQPASSAANSVVDSGSCAFERVGDPATGNFKLTITGMDTSGSSYPTESKAGTPLESGKHYVGAFAVTAFVPFDAVDALDGTPGNASGAVQLWNRVGDFDPIGISGASNHGDGVEPGYCAPGPNTDRSTKCADMPAAPGAQARRSNNVADAANVRIVPGNWWKALVHPTGTWGAGKRPLPESANTIGDGKGQVQPGETFGSHITARLSIDAKNLEFCDVFDNSTLKIERLAGIAGNTSSDPVWNAAYAAVVATAPGQNGIVTSRMPAFQSNWVFSYGHVDLTGDNPNLGSFDTAHDRWRGDWTRQQSAASRPNIACGDPAVTWYDTPDQVPGGADEVNAVWVRAADGYVQPAATTATMMLGLQQRDRYHGGPHAGATIPDQTVAANFANLRSSTFGPWAEKNDFVPAAGTTAGGDWQDRKGSRMGDRWTLTRATMAVSKHTTDGTVDGTQATGAAPAGSIGSARAGSPVIWQIDSSLGAATDHPAPIDDLVITDTLPAGAEYDAAATAEIPGNRLPTSVTTRDDGTTVLTWRLGERVPNEALPVLKIATHVDPLLANGTKLTNTVAITADGIVPNPARHQATHAVTVTQPGTLQLKKSVDQTLDLQDQDQKYSLEIRNFSETLTIEKPTIIEVLPYNGDATNDARVNRSPASSFAGENRIEAAPKAFLIDEKTPAAGTFLFTTIDPKRVPQDLDHDTDPTIWSPDFTADATAFKFVAADALGVAATGDSAGLKITFTTKQSANAAGDRYANRFTAFSDTLANGGRHQLLTSNQVTVRVVGYSIGDLIWLDRDDDGVFTPGVDEAAPAGVAVEVRNAETGELVPGGSTTTGANGRWIVNSLPQGDYFATIPASQFAPGGPLAGYAAQRTGAIVDPNAGVDEGLDHNTIQHGPAVRSGVLKLRAKVDGSRIEGQAPIGDNVAGLPVPPGVTDDFTNLTLDLALTAIPGYEFTKTADPESGTTVAPGSTISYTLTGRNTGGTGLDDVEIGDELAGVLKHAELVGDPIAEIPGSATNAPAPELNGTKLSWRGALQVGQQIAITYRVRVDPDAWGTVLENRADSRATPRGLPSIAVPSVVTEHPTPERPDSPVTPPQPATPQEPATPRQPGVPAAPAPSAPTATEPGDAPLARTGGEGRLGIAAAGAILLVGGIVLFALRPRAGRRGSAPEAGGRAH